MKNDPTKEIIFNCRWRSKDLQPPCREKKCKFFSLMIQVCDLWKDRMILSGNDSAGKKLIKTIQVWYINDSLTLYSTAFNVHKLVMCFMQKCMTNVYCTRQLFYIVWVILLFFRAFVCCKNKNVCLNKKLPRYMTSIKNHNKMTN